MSRRRLCEDYDIIERRGGRWPLNDAVQCGEEATHRLGVVLVCARHLQKHAARGGFGPDFPVRIDTTGGEL